ncbi:MAG TPA: Holliday junction resolvase RuvX [Burkholderiales bacterium]|nr:Holliday junction resolvase RuvX [Burkholderiales bacterium]
MTVPPATNTTVLAFDFGEKRIGVAVGDLAVRIAHPLATIDAEDNQRRFGEIQKLIADWRPARLVVGLPMHADGTEHELSRLSRRFAQRLEGRFGLPVSLVDERFTSVAAESRLRESGVRNMVKTLDAAAASEILQSWLESAPGDTSKA